MTDLVHQAFRMAEISQMEVADARYALKQMGVHIQVSENMRSEAEKLREELTLARQAIYRGSSQHREDVSLATLVYCRAW
jgi:hypothetical protein